MAEKKKSAKERNTRQSRKQLVESRDRSSPARQQKSAYQPNGLINYN